MQVDDAQYPRASRAASNSLARPWRIPKMEKAQSSSGVARRAIVARPECLHEPID
jgi:hypothetical protein